MQIFDLLLNLLQHSETQIYDSRNLIHICNQFISDLPTLSIILSNVIKVSPLLSWVISDRDLKNNKAFFSLHASSLGLGWTVAKHFYSGLFGWNIQVILFIGWGLAISPPVKDCITKFRKTLLIIFPVFSCMFSLCRSQCSLMNKICPIHLRKLKHYLKKR